MTTATLITGVIVATIWVLLCNSMLWLNVLLSIIPLIFLYLIIQFFRVPNRTTAGNSNDVICPADGKVVVIERVFEPEFIKQDCIQISIFMSPLNVHANYVPIAGNVVYTKYHKGSYLVAWHPKSSTENERSTMVIETSSKKSVLVRQIAGALDLCREFSLNGGAVPGHAARNHLPMLGHEGGEELRVLVADVRCIFLAACEAAFFFAISGREAAPFFAAHIVHRVFHVFVVPGISIFSCVSCHFLSPLESIVKGYAMISGCEGRSSRFSGVPFGKSLK